MRWRGLNISTAAFDSRLKSAQKESAARDAVINPAAMNVRPVSPKRKTLAWLSLVLLGAAVASALALWGGDVRARFEITSWHRNAESLAMMLVGLAYVTCQFIQDQPREKTVKGTLLGAAFFLWGLEQFLPEGSLLTFIDSLIITFFVIDLGLVIIERRNAGKGARSDSHPEAGS